MKLTEPQIAQIKDQIGVEPVPAKSPTTEVLTKHFGEHTFYADEAGLHVFETVERPQENGPYNVHPVKVASWVDDNMDALAPHDPVVGPPSAKIYIEKSLDRDQRRYR